MEKNTAYVTKHDLSSLFEKTLKLIPPTWKASLPSAAIIYVPVTAVSVLFIRYYFGFMGGIVSMEDSGISALGPLFVFLGLCLAFALVVSIAIAMGEGIVSRNAFLAATGEKASWLSLFREIAGGKFLKILLFYLLQFLVFMGLAVGAGILSGVSGVLMAFKGPALAIGVIVLILTILAVYLSIFILSYVLQTGIPAIVNEGLGPAQALSRAFKLARGNVLRISGISFVFGLALSFGLSIAATPLMIAVMVPLFLGLKDFALMASGGANDVAGFMASIGKAIALPYGVVIGVMGIGSLLISPLFRTLLYLDLRVRSGDLPDTAEFSGLGRPTAGTPQA